MLKEIHVKDDASWKQRYHAPAILNSVARVGSDHDNK
jgi:hypothetical protein